MFVLYNIFHIKGNILLSDLEKHHNATEKCIASEFKKIIDNLPPEIKSLSFGKIKGFKIFFKNTFYLNEFILFILKNRTILKCYYKFAK